MASSCSDCPPARNRAAECRLVDGSFVDYQGILERVSDDHRVAILLSLLGRQVRVFVPAASISAA